MHEALERCAGHNFYPGFRATIVRALLAAHAVAGDAAGGLTVVQRSLALGSTPLWEPEAHRLTAEFLARTGADTAEVDAALARADAIARRRGAHGQLRLVERSRRRLLDRRPAEQGDGPPPRRPDETPAKRSGNAASRMLPS
jgi:hypothetical protein